jgi:uncharacterized coiled-coil DUF342 family protein
VPRLNELRDEIKRLSEESQKYHTQMLEFYKKAREVRKEADTYHERLKEKYALLSPLQNSITSAKKEIKKLRSEISVFLDRYDEIQREKNREKEIKKLEKAKKKLRETGKLTLDDLKVLLEEGGLELK